MHPHPPQQGPLIFCQCNQEVPCCSPLFRFSASQWGPQQKRLDFVCSPLALSLGCKPKAWELFPSAPNVHHRTTNYAFNKVPFPTISLFLSTSTRGKEREEKEVSATKLKVDFDAHAYLSLFLYNKRTLSFHWDVIFSTAYVAF